MARHLKWLACFGPGSSAIIGGIGAAVLWSITLPMLKVVIGDTVGFATSDGLEANGGRLGPWRPATPTDVQRDFRHPDLPVERFVAREGWIDGYLHRIHLTVLRDKQGELGDAITQLEPRWRVGWAIFVVSGTTVGLIVAGWLWIITMRRLMFTNAAPKGDSRVLP